MNVVGDIQPNILRVSERRVVYLYGLPAAILVLALGIVLLQLGVIQNAFDAVAQPILLVFLLVLLGLFFVKKDSLDYVELPLVTGLFLYFTSSLAYALTYPEGVNVAGELSAFVGWSTSIYTIIFWMFGSKRGLSIAKLYFTAMTLATLLAFLPALLSGQGLNDLYYLVQLYFASGLFIRIIFVLVRSLEQRSQETRALTLEANTDRLTQVHNRRFLEATLAQAFDATAEGRGFSVILIDIDHFKRINDTFGHVTGDAVLTQLARLLQAGVRTGDVLGRWGGEEFLIILPDIGLDQAHAAAERLRRSVETYSFHTVISVTASFGVGSYQAGDDERKLLERADAALYQAKAGGRNKVAA